MIASRNLLSVFNGGALLSVTLMAASLAVGAEGADCFPALDDAHAWSRLPPLAQGGRQPLPVWARILADSLPRTTAAMLELDALHRAKNPLGAVLAAEARKTVAEANRCSYSMACAEADLERAVSEVPIAALSSDVNKESDKERLVLAFARRLTLEADTITDQDVARLIEVIGEAKLVALVLLVAHANFQDRLFLTLGNVTDLGRPLPPLVGRFAKAGKDEIAVPARIMPEPATASSVPDRVGDPEWRSLDFAALQRNLDTQRSRPGRIRVPPWEQVLDTIPEDQRPKHPVRILWTLVCRGYQPELAAGWSACLRIFAEESKQDRVFEESVFWIITRTIHCFY